MAPRRLPFRLALPCALAAALLCAPPSAAASTPQGNARADWDQAPYERRRLMDRRRRR